MNIQYHVQVIETVVDQTMQKLARGKGDDYVMRQLRKILSHVRSLQAHVGQEAKTLKYWQGYKRGPTQINYRAWKRRRNLINGQKTLVAKGDPHASGLD